MKKPTAFAWNSFIGGTSEDEFIGVPGSYSDSINVDTRSFPRGVKLAPKRISTGLSASLGVGETITKLFNMTPYSLTGYLLAGTSAGRVFQYNGSAWSLVWDIGATSTDLDKPIREINCLYVYADSTTYIYVFTKNNAHKCKIDFSAKVVDFKVMTGAGTVHGSSARSVRRPTIHWNEDLLLAVDNVIYNVDGQTGDLTVNNVLESISLAVNELIVSLTNFADQIRIYATSGLKIDQTNSAGAYGKIYFWSGKVGTPTTYSVKHESLPFAHATSDGQNDYVVSKNDSCAWIFTGADKQLLRRFYGEDLAYTSSLFKGMGVFASKYDFYTYGSLKTSLPPIWKREARISDTGTDNVFDILVQDDLIYFALDTDVIYFDYSQIPSKFATHGRIASQQFNAGSMWMTKKISEIILCFDNDKVGKTRGTINLYAVYDNGPTYELLKTIDPGVAGGVVRIHNDALSGSIKTEFKTIKFMVELKSDVADSESPIFYELYMMYDVLNK